MDFQHMPDELALKQLLYDFVDAGLHGRFAESFDLVDEFYSGIGMGEQGVVQSKEEALLVLRDSFRLAEGTTITFDVQGFTIKWLGEDAAIAFGEVVVINAPAKGKPQRSGLMQTIGARRSSGRWRIAFTHASPVLLTKESIEAFPVRFLDEAYSALRTDLLEKALPQCDALTGILNREGLGRRATELMRDYNPKHNTVLFMLDLDNFKQINDRMGHQIGDTVLKQVAQTLHSTFRDGDAIARVGGDEFMVLLSGDFSVKFLERKANVLLKTMRLQVTDQQQMPVSVSIGIAYGRARTTFEKLYRVADAALYAAKQAGKSRYYLINSDTNTPHGSGAFGGNLLTLQTLLNRVDGKKPSIGKTPYEALVENIPGGVIMFNFSYEKNSITFTMCNEWFSRLVGYSNDEITVMQEENPFIFVHLDDLPMVTRAMNEMVDGVDSSHIIYRIRHKDGSYSHINQATTVTERSRTGIIVFGTLSDVEEVMHLKQTVEDSRRELVTLLETMPGGVLVISLTEQVRLTHRNHWAPHFLGYTPEEVAAMEQVAPFQLVHPDDLEEVGEVVQRLRAGDEHANFVYRLLAKDGNYRYVRIDVSLAERRADEAIFYGIITDVDELIQAQNSMEQAYHRGLREAEELRRMARGLEHDELTGLFNKSVFYQEAQRLIESYPEEDFVLVRWNLERFKVINDLFGASVGDQVLKILALELQKYTDGLATLARLESDHFVSCHFAKNFSIDATEEFLRQQFSPPEINYPIILKCGIYEIDDKTIPVDQMCDRANLALQTIKGKYMTQYAFYDNALRQTLLDEQEIEGDMTKALEEGQFVVYYQPIYSVSSKRPISAEALVRWQHPTKGMISPGVFIPLFEKNGFISKLDRYVREQTVRFIAHSQSLQRPILPISVNISRIEFYSVDFCDSLIRLVEQYRVHPSMLRLEITESAYAQNADALLRAMLQLQQYGFQILMDDFGSGYSSLNMLKDIPVDILKIDMRFVQDISYSDRAASVLSSVVRMAKWLEMKVVAEGVETAGQLTFLRSIGCDSVQGYYYSKPLPEADFVQLLERDALETSRQKESSTREEPDFDVFWNAQQGVAVLNAMVDPVGIYEMGEDQLELLCVNDAYYEMTGMTPSTLSSETLQAASWIYQEDRELLFQACRQAVQNRQIQRIKMRRHHDSGRMLWVDMRIRYIGHRNTRDVLCFAMDDITTQENQQRMSEIDPCIADILYTYHVIYQLDYTEMTATATYYTSGSVLSTDRAELSAGLGVFLEKVHPYDRPALMEALTLKALHRCFADGKKTVDVRARISHRGQYLWFSMALVRTAHAEGHELYLACVKVRQEPEDEEDVLSPPQLIQPILEEKPGQAEQKRLKVLVVDDNQLNRMMLRKILADQYDVLEAENGQQALELLAKDQEDIVAVMLDLIMPIMDGYAFLQARAANDVFADIPVIVLSPSDVRDAELQSLSLGANDFLKKPYEPVVLKQRLENFIRMREIAEHNKRSEETIRALMQSCALLEESNTRLQMELEQAKNSLQ